MNMYKRYFGNVWLALCGRNPFKEELEKTKKDCEVKLITERDEYDGRLKKETASMQQLVENLRERVAKAEKDVEDANKTLSRFMMMQQMLEKTNNNLEDLACFMEIGKAERLREFSQNLDWNNVLLCIAKCHISVLSRKDELEQRQREAAQRADNFNFD